MMIHAAFDLMASAAGRPFTVFQKKTKPPHVV